MPPTSSKHQRTSSSKLPSSASTNTKNKKKVPNPPRALITLIQKDKAVLNYFTKLQQSLDEDVQEWKERALDYRRRLKDLEKATASSKGTCITSASATANGINSTSSKKGKSLKRKSDDELFVDQRRRRRDGNAKEIFQNEDYNKEYDDGFIEEQMNKERIPMGKQKDIRINEDTSPPFKTVALFEESDDSENDNDHNIDDEFLAFDPLENGKSSERKEVSSSSVDKSHKMLRQKKKEGDTENKKSSSKLILSSDDSEDDTIFDRGKSFQTKKKNDEKDDSEDDSGDDDDDDDSDDDLNSFMKEFQSKSLQKSNEEEKRKLYNQVLTQLIQAYRCLESLGVHLVHIEEMVVDDEEEEQPHENVDKSELLLEKSSIEGELNDDISLVGKDEIIDNKPIKRKLIKTRRSDVDIITELMRSLRSLIRTPSVEMNKMFVGKGEEANFVQTWFQPFITCDYIPCCYNYDFKKNEFFFDTLSFEGNESFMKDIPQHPMVEALNSICYSLAILDMYCSSNSPFIEQDEWNDIFSFSHGSNKDIDGDILDTIKLGMHGRNICQLLQESIHGEICTWPILERNARGTQTSLEYKKDYHNMSEQDTDDDEETEKKNKVDSTYAKPYAKVVRLLVVKNQNRYFQMLERICLARIVSFLYQYKSDTQNAARLIIEYIMAGTPSPAIEDYPRYMPSISMCILEALLLPIHQISRENLTSISCPQSTFLDSSYDSWFSKFLFDVSEGSVYLGHALSVSIHSVLNIWKNRKESNDKRIHEMSDIEVAAFNRFARSEDWLHQHNNFDYPDLLDIITSRVSEFKATSYLALPLHLSLIQSGDITSVIKSMVSLTSKLDIRDHDRWKVFIPLFEGCVVIQHLRWDTNCLQGIVNLDQVQSQQVDDEQLGLILDSLLAKNEEIINQFEIKNLSMGNYVFGSTVLKCCLILGDGLRATKIVSSVVPHICPLNGWYARNIHEEIRTILSLSEYPLVRVINLKSRPDRWKNITTQAQRHNLFIVLAVATLALYDSKDYNVNEKMYWGSQAYSGLDSNHLKLEEMIKTELDDMGENKKEVTDFVSTHWRPRDLQAFDKLARSDDSLVRASVTERACAFSHISSWYGVYNSLVQMKDSFINDSACRSSMSDIDPKYITQLFRISGFARGSPMFPDNDDMLPCPVCVILEDDALLVDRFSERLESILAELPRDFHYCSLGYSRPRNAPMVPYAGQIAIPTCLWYCTGYVLSLEGAKYLIDSLPVVGPVDSWIGLKMTANWDNTFGERVGVGITTKVTIEDSFLPSRKDLNSIMKFRAFAALTPLCSQKLQWSSSEAGDKNRAKWRDRDTDVCYSGSRM